VFLAKTGRTLEGSDEQPQEGAPETPVRA
jgi:hypothetical protein